jgi:polyphosphate kinase
MNRDSRISLDTAERPSNTGAGPHAAMSRLDVHAPTDLADPRLYINRELSLLDFNRRVLEQARDSQTPLLERLRFLGICCTNLDEFFEIRASGLRQQVAFGVSQPGMDGLRPQ